MLSEGEKKSGKKVLNYELTYYNIHSLFSMKFFVAWENSSKQLVWYSERLVIVGYPMCLYKCVIAYAMHAEEPFL